MRDAPGCRRPGRAALPSAFVPGCCRCPEDRPPAPADSPGWPGPAGLPTAARAGQPGQNRFLPGEAAASAADKNVDVRLYRIIYQAIEEIEAAIKGMLAPEFVEKILGHAEVRQLFKVSGVGTIAGCHVTDGKITRNSQVRINRDGIVVHEGELSSLKRFKDDAKEVAEGYECGVTFEKFNDLKEGDIVEAFIMEKVERT